MEAQRFYITFGVQYRTEPHPSLPRDIAHPSGVMAITAPNEDLARKLAHAVTDGAYAFLYPWGEGPSEKHHPRGVTSVISFLKISFEER